MNLTKRISVPLIVLIIIIGIAATALAAVTAITWIRTYSITVVSAGATTSTTPNYQGYSNSACTTAIASGGSESLGSVSLASTATRDFYVKDNNGVGGSIHYSYSESSAPAGLYVISLNHVHADGSPHSLEAHTIGATDCIPVRLTVSLPPATAPTGTKTITITIGRP